MNTQPIAVHERESHPQPTLGSETLPPPPIGLCLSTGRTGTSYLARVLAATYGDVAHICHERAAATDARIPGTPPAPGGDGLGPHGGDPDVDAHVNRIAALAADRPYIDLGRPILPLVSHLVTRFPGRVRLLHLVRDPVSVAAADTAAGHYQDEPAARGSGSEWLPNPFGSHCAHPEVRETWSSMAPFEKNLWRWGEYNAAVMRIRERFPNIPVLLMRSSELFTSSVAIAWVGAFLGLPPRKPAAQLRLVSESEHHPAARHAVGPEWKRYRDYPWVLELADLLGVPVDPDGLEERMGRYARPDGAGTRRWRHLPVEWMAGTVAHLTRSWGGEGGSVRMESRTAG